MGDRGNIVLRHDNGQDIYLYTHDYGSHIGYILSSGLKRAGKERWDNDAYLTRIIFSEMVRGEEMENTGFGIATYAPDNDHPLIVVDVPRQHIYLAMRQTPHVPISSVMSFKEYVSERPAMCSWLCPVDDIRAVAHYIFRYLQFGMRFGSDMFCNRHHPCHTTIRYDILDKGADFYETRQLFDYAVDFLHERKLVQLVMYMDSRCGLPLDYDVVLTEAGKADSIDFPDDSPECMRIKAIIMGEPQIGEAQKDDIPF